MIRTSPYLTRTGRICLSIAAGLNLFAAIADPNLLRTLPAVGLAYAAGFAWGRKETTR
jgi:hypothetical protein